MTPEQRQAYVTRLINRVHKKIATARAPIGSEDWDDYCRVDTVFLDATDAFERGEITKDELDEKAVAYLQVWGSNT
jgi:hypothetical protein